MGEKHSWLDGPQIPGEFDNPDKFLDYPDQALGLASDGPGSQATLARHVGDVPIDWVISLMIAGASSMFSGSSKEQIEQLGDSFIAWQSFLAAHTSVVFLIIGTVSVWLFACTPSQWTMKMGVACVDKPGGRVGFVCTPFRSLFTLFLLLLITTDPGMCGMYDHATGTAVALSQPQFRLILQQPGAL